MTDRPGGPRRTAFRVPALAAVMIGLGTGTAAAGPDIAAVEAAMAGCSPENAARCSNGYFNRCAEAGRWTPEAMVQCQDMLADYWDGRLNIVYVEAMTRAVDDAKRDLRATQRTWIRWRDARCGFYKHFSGTIRRSVAAGCMAETSRRRVGDLEMIRDNLP